MGATRPTPEPGRAPPPQRRHLCCPTAVCRSFERRPPVPTPDTEPRVPFSLTPKDSSFYPLFTASAENLVAATDVLSDFIHDHARRAELAGKLRDLEHAGDQTTHAIFRQLNTSFVTPFDREDIYNLASDLDDVMDYVEAAADLV